MVSVKLVGVTKRFGETVAVDRLTVEIEHGELFTFLGPSGCGKSTTLRVIAGFELPEEGRVFFDEQDVTLLKPYKRGVAMVFQNYALWPHMTVFDNVAYGLKLRKLPKQEVRERVKRILELVRLEGLEDRYPSQLSGGQQQRVALARALVVEPKVLLLDEPLSNLDAKLRLEMREEIKRIQRELGITTIYVTHDQEEAMSISDRVAILNKGRLMQVGTPQEIYYRPANVFVASFIGRSYVLEGKALKFSDGVVTAVFRGLKLKGLCGGDCRVREGEEVYAVLKPEFFKLDKPGEESNEIEGIVTMVMFIGTHNNVKVRVGSVDLNIYLDPDFLVKQGDKLKLYLPVSRVYIFPAKDATLPY